MRVYSMYFARDPHAYYIELINGFRACQDSAIQSATACHHTNKTQPSTKILAYDFTFATQPSSFRSSA